MDRPSGVWPLFTVLNPSIRTSPLKSELRSTIATRRKREYLGSGEVPSLAKETSELLSQHDFFSGWKFVRQRGTAQPEALGVNGLIIWRSVFPAAKHDAYPFESQSA
jgi:hypothetical protein